MTSSDEPGRDRPRTARIDVSELEEGPASVSGETSWPRPSTQDLPEAAPPAEISLLSAPVLQAPPGGTSRPRTVSTRSPNLEIEEGQLINQFRVLRFLGKGGTGHVYLARDTRLGRKVAIKIVRYRYATEISTFVKRFIQEARNTARFNHPNIVTLYEVGEYEGNPYLVLEYLDGQTLRERLQTGGLGEYDTIRITEKIASALAEAHHHGTLHLDLKPGNIMIAKDGRLRVLDFGLAEPIQAALLSSTDPEAEAQRAMAGTPQYMAPEQWARKAITPAVDIWSLGVVMYELLTGDRPYADFESDWATLAHTVMNDAPAPRLTSEGECADLVARCLDKDASVRPSAAEVMEVLRGWLARPSLPQQSEESPFRGLLPFTTRQAAQFYGRDLEISELVERLRDEPTLAVVGASGAGKSSFVKAGVVPRLLNQGGWLVFQMRPGLEPFKSLAMQICRRNPSTASASIDVSVDNEAMLDVARQLHSYPEVLSARLEQIAAETEAKVLLVIDQLEEAYTLGADEDRQNRFIRAITSAADDAADPVRVVFTVRDDFLHRLAAAGPKVRAVLRRMMLLQVPEPEALAETLTKPVQAAGYRFEETRIVHEMVQAVGGKPSSLPLLQFAAQKLWERRDRKKRLLTKEAYAGIGGVAGVLARHADGVLDSLLPDERQIARQILLRLVTPEDTRRVRSEVDTLEGLGSDAPGVLNRLMEARLISSVWVRDADGHRALELAHESLIETWGRLRAWIDESREELRYLQEIGQTAEVWWRRGARGEEVWSGDALSEALRVRTRITTPVPQTVDRFLDAGRKRALRQEWRKRIWFAVAFVLVSVVAVVLFYQREEAVAQKKRALVAGHHVALERAEAEREAAEAAWTRGNVLEARAKVRASLEIDDSTLVRSLWGQLRQDALMWSQDSSSMAERLAFSSDGAVMAVAFSDTTVRLYDLLTGSAKTLRGHDDRMSAVDFSLDGTLLAAGSFKGTVYLWNVEERKILRTLAAHEGRVYHVRFDGAHTLFTSGSDGQILVWNLQKGEITTTVEHTGPGVTSFALSPDRTLLAATQHSDIRLYDLRTKTSTVVGRHDSRALSVAFSPDGRSIVSTGQDDAVRLWSVDGASSRSFPAPSVWNASASFSRTGKQIAVAGEAEQGLRIFDAASGSLVGGLGGRTAYTFAAYSPDGQWLASIGKGVRMWNPEKGTRTAIKPHSGGINAVDFSPDGSRLATVGVDGKIRIWRRDTGVVERVIAQPAGSIFRIAFHPDGERVAVASETVRLIDITGQRTDVVVHSDGNIVYAIAFDDEGRHLVVSGRRIWMYDSQTMQLKKTFRHPNQSLSLGVDVSPDGRWIVSSGDDAWILVWDSWGRDPTRVMQAPAPVWGVAFDPTGRFIGASELTGGLRWWDWRSGTSRQVGQHTGRVYYFDISPDGRFFAAPSVDHVPRVWNIATSTLAMTLPSHSGEVNQVKISADGRWAATAGDDGVVQVSDMKTGRLAWKTTALFASEGAAVTHRGWVDVETNALQTHASRAWRRRVSEHGVRAAEGRSSPHMCLLTVEDTLEIWDRSQDRQLWSHPVRSATDVFASPNGCVVLAGYRAHLYFVDRTDPRQLVSEGASAIFANQTRIAVSTGETISVFDEAGRFLEALPGGVGITALNAVFEGVWIGYQDGGIRFVSNRMGEASVESFRNIPSSPVTRLILGPRRTLIAGFTNGTIGMWNLETRRLLRSERLHGPIWFLSRSKARLMAASRLGWTTSWDLSVFDDSRCDLLREVWGAVPYVWSKGRAISRPPPSRHACLE